MSRYRDCIPVRTEGSGTRYDGRVWYEYLSSLKFVNGLAADKPLEKSDLKHGDRITVEFEANYSPES